MKRFTFALFFLLISFYSNAQLLSVDQHGLSLYNSGSELLKEGKYTEAEEKFSEALGSYRTANVYYNRAVARMHLKDTVGFCDDMFTASRDYADREATKLLNIMCCKNVDTLFYDKKLNIVSSSDYRFYETFKDLKYKELTFGELHDIKHHGIFYSPLIEDDKNLMNITTVKSDIIGYYEIVNSEKYYSRLEKPALIVHVTKTEELKEKVRTYFNIKYKALKTENNFDKLKVYFVIYVNKTGEIDKVKFIGVFPNIGSKELDKEMAEDIRKIANDYPKFRPARILNKRVNFVGIDYIEF